MTATMKKTISVVLSLALLLSTLCAWGVPQAHAVTSSDLKALPTDSARGTLQAMGVYGVYHNGYTFVTSTCGSGENGVTYSDVVNAKGEFTLKGTKEVSYVRSYVSPDLVQSVRRSDGTFGLYKVDGTCLAKTGSYRFMNTTLHEGEIYLFGIKSVSGKAYADVFNMEGKKVVSGALPGVPLTADSGVSVGEWYGDYIMFNTWGNANNRYLLKISSGKFVSSGLKDAALCGGVAGTKDGIICRDSTKAVRIISSTGKVYKYGVIKSAYEKSDNFESNNSWIGMTQWDWSGPTPEIHRYLSRVTGKWYTVPAGCKVVGLYGKSYILVKQTGSTPSKDKWFTVNGKGEKVMTIAARSYKNTKTGKSQWADLRVMDGGAYFNRYLDGDYYETARFYSWDFSKYRDTVKGQWLTRYNGIWSAYSDESSKQYDSSLKEISGGSYNSAYGKTPSGADVFLAEPADNGTGAWDRNGLLASGAKAKAGDYYMALAPSNRVLNNTNFDLFYVKTTKGKYGAVNSAGKVVIPVEYDDISDMNSGQDMILVKKSGKWYLASLYAFAGVAKTSVSTISSPSVGQLKVTWTAKKGVYEANGYQVRYSTSSAMSNATTVKATSYKTASKTISSLTSGKKYYVQIRTYKTATNGKTYYSSWSTAKSVTVK